MFCLIGLCVASKVDSSKTTISDKKTDNKEKRDAAIAGPYTYEAPQKTFQVPIHTQSQQKVAPVEYHHTSQKVAPLEWKQQQKPIHIPAQYAHEPAQQYSSSYGYPTGIESFYNQPIKSSYNFPSFHSFDSVPSINYIESSPELTNFGYKSQAAPAFAHIQSYNPYKSFSHGSPAPAYSFNDASYAFPQHQQQQQQHLNYQVPSYVQSFQQAPAQYSHGYSQSPSAIFVPQTVSIQSKPTKTPDYALGLKGLSHFSTISSPVQTSYIKPSYDLHQSSFTQTERPFKASAFLGTTHLNRDSHTQQTIASYKPSNEYLAPSKTYLPAREQEYQIQYVQAPSKNYLPPTNNYLPPKTVTEAPKNNYLPPPQPTNSYLPPVTQYSHSQPQQHYQQQYQPESYESFEYQHGGSQSGHSEHK